MIELIFVIVIIGILAAVAIPKLAATRDDAKITKTVANLKTTLSDAAAFYTAQGKGSWSDTTEWIAVTNALGSTTATLDTAVNIMGDDVACFTITPVSDDNTTRLDVTFIGSGPVCIGAESLAKSSGLIDANSESNITLGGKSVKY